MPNYREVFERSRGFRLHKDDASLGWMMGALGQPLSEQQLFTFASALTKFLAATGVSVSTPIKYREAITPNDFPDRASETMRKFVSRSTWEDHLSQGRFQLGSPALYRRTENDRVRDGHEGLSFLSLSSQHRSFHSFIDVGANVALLCGTHEGNADTGEMEYRFGDVQIEIDAGPFAERMAAAIGAASFHIHDVVYSDAKTFRAQRDFSNIESQWMGLPPPRDLNPQMLRTINREMWEGFFDLGLLASIFCKPESRYAVEKERRIAFVLPQDLSTDALAVCDKQLLNHVRVVGA